MTVIGSCVPAITSCSDMLRSWFIDAAIVARFKPDPSSYDLALRRWSAACECSGRTKTALLSPAKNIGLYDLKSATLRIRDLGRREHLVSHSSGRKTKTKLRPAMVGWASQAESFKSPPGSPKRSFPAAGAGTPRVDGWSGHRVWRADTYHRHSSWTVLAKLPWASSHSGTRPTPA